MGWLINWILSALALIGTAYLVPGFNIRGVGAALIAAVVIGLVNATLGSVLKLITFPFALLTLGIASLFVNAFLVWFAALLVPGFTIVGFWAAFWGAVVLSLLNMLLSPLRGRA
ncbi:phage holin family protein [Anthocerotibacter panamensis]|uniref:phage holin family protein n=1 Tax=Anthocerotibacter panamensis TaxID=2857077 RepID=UPI001C406908|nr:phage holin family protein [Anthocerotibacter panamensis]